MIVSFQLPSQMGFDRCSPLRVPFFSFIDIHCTFGGFTSCHPSLPNAAIQHRLHTRLSELSPFDKVLRPTATSICFTSLPKNGLLYTHAPLYTAGHTSLFGLQTSLNHMFYLSKRKGPNFLFGLKTTSKSGP